MSILKRPILAVPLGLKALFAREAKDKGFTRFEEVVEIDPTHPGLPEEIMEMLRGDYDDLEAANNNKKPEKGHLRLITLNGQKLEP